MARYGLLGRAIDYSFSRSFFNEKFLRENRSDIYVNLDFQSIEDFILWFKTQNDLAGFNVTIPYKEAICAYLDYIDPEARAIGAVNTVIVASSGALLGYNTDLYGFKRSLEQWGQITPKKALILGTGGAAKAVTYALRGQGYEILQVSRQAGIHDNIDPDKDADGLSLNKINYRQISPERIKQYPLIVNCTPVGTYPNTKACPELPYDALGPDHYLYDLIYNPEETEFLKRGFKAGAQIKNGQQMLEFQALAAWDPWQKIAS